MYSVSSGATDNPPAAWRKSHATDAPDQLRFAGLAQDLAECAQPVGLRHSPLAIACHHVAVVDADPAADEAGIDISSQPREVAIRVLPLGRRGSGIRERVVLVGGERELAPGRAAEIEPRPRHRRRPTDPNREVD